MSQTSIPPGSVYGGLTVSLGAPPRDYNPDNQGHGYLHLGRGGHVDVTLTWPATAEGVPQLDALIWNLTAARDDLRARVGAA